VITIDLAADLTSHPDRLGRRHVVPGAVELHIGASSTDIRAVLPVVLVGDRREVGTDRVLHAEVTVAPID
jgi:beta-xylosidase